MAEGSEMSVCCKCFGNAGLQYRIIELQADATTGPCEAHPNEMGIPLSVAAGIIDAALRENFGSGISDEREEHLDGRDLDDLIHEIVQPADDELARILKDHLIDNDSYWRPDGEEVFYSDECTYFPTEIGTANYGTRWAQFRDHLMHDQRFFSRSAFGYLREIFEGVESRLDPEGKSPVYMIKPGDPASKFFRARGIRAIHDVKTFREDLAGELGPPPQRLRSAGRLNPAGVAVFYAAFDPITCVGELRPSVGSLVAVAEFKIEKPICVLDTTRYTAQPNPPNIFQPGAISEAAQWNFMRNFMQLISRPIKPGDEHIDYIPTQAVAEYLAFHHECLVDGNKRHIDAIIFKSAQNDGEGTNIAIIGPAAVTGIIGADGKPYPSKEAEKQAKVFGKWAIKEIDVRITPIEGSFNVHQVKGAIFQRLNITQAIPSCFNIEIPSDWE